MDDPDIERTTMAGLALAVAVGVTAVLVGLRGGGLLQGMELKVHDVAKAFQADRTPAPDVVIVPIDEEDIAAWGWPIADERLASIVRAASGAGAAVLGVDLYRDLPVGSGQSELTTVFAQTGAIAISKLGSAGQQGIPPPSYLLASGAHGFSDVPLDADGVARRALLLVNDGAEIKLSFATQLALRMLGQEGLRPWPKDQKVLLFGNTPVPRISGNFGAYRNLDDAGYQILIDYRHALPIAQSVPARDLVGGKVSPGALAGKVVLIGTSSEGAKDYFLTPLNQANGAAQALGVQVHAAVVQQLIDYGRGTTAPITSPGRVWQTIMIFFSALVGSAAIAASRTPAMTLAVGPGLALVLGGALAAALVYGLWLPAVPVAMAWAGASLAMFGTLSFLRQRQFRAVSRLFASHLSPGLAKEVWRSRHVILKGGKPAPRRLFSTVLFVDLAGSTAIGGGAEPEAFMGWVSSLLDSISRVATDHGGFVEKFTGDGMMVVFGAPLPRTSDEATRLDAEAACHCALAIADAVTTLNSGGRLIAPYRVRIGIHSGEVFGGTIGTTGTLRYNVMGDTVNLAARIEAFGKKVDNRQDSSATICLSSETVRLAGRGFDFRPVGELGHDDGRSVLSIYKLMGTTA